MSDVTLQGEFGQGGAPIVESGSNANGEYVKWADGTMICTYTRSTTLTANITAGSLFVSSDISLTFPAAFTDSPVLTFSSSRSTGGGQWCVNEAPSTTSVAGVRIVSYLTGAAGYLNYIAIGRWK